MGKAWMVIVLMAAIGLCCTNELETGEEGPPPNNPEGPSGVDEGVQVDEGDTCIGLQENPANLEFSPKCESLFTSEEFQASNGACLILDDNPDQPCFCKICGVKGGGDTMKFLCLKVVCNGAGG
jgi:hypothetical protein